MDSFTENILARARERQKMLEGYSEGEKTPLREPNNKKSQQKIPTACSQPNLTDSTKVKRNEIVSDSSIASKISNFNNNAHKENLSEGNLPKFTRQNSKTCVSSDIPASPKPQLKTFNIQNDNFNMEIKVTSSENLRLQVEIEEQDNSDSDTGSQHSNSEVGLREDAKNSLKRLGKLYAGGDDANISSPIHRTESKFHEQDNGAVNEMVKDNDSSDDAPKGRKGLRRLADLAQTINQWEDDINPTNRKIEKKSSTPKRAWKPPAPQPPSTMPSSPVKPSQKPRAPEPPSNNKSYHKTETYQENKTPVTSSTKSSSSSQIVGVTPKQLKWDKTVLDTLESQGFTRTTSSSRLVYAYDSQDKKHNNEVKTASTSKIDRSTKNSTIQEEQEPEEPERKSTKNSPTKECPKSPVKAHLRTTSIANKAALFESSPSKTIKDPALLSVSERKALFEKNKGAALVPKAAFGMAAPLKSESTKPSAVKARESAKTIEKTPLKHGKSPKAPVVESSPTVAAVAQAGGIASKMAALLQGKSTISQAQIENNVREERKKEMDMLLNRFNKNKQTPNKAIVEEQESCDDDDYVDTDEDDYDENDVIEETAMISDKSKIVSKVVDVQQPSSSSETRRSSGKRCNKADSPKVAAVLDDVKRIRVSPAKAGKLYPNLSDIEAATETETENPTPSPNNSSFEDNVYESDDANTSFGREILQAVCKNQTPQKRPILDESTASDLSSLLDDMDDNYLDEAEIAENYSPGPTPPKQGRRTPPLSNGPQPSHSFNYKNFTTSVSPKSQFRSPIKIKTSPRKSSEFKNTYVVEGDSVLPLTHTVSFYRKQQTQASHTPVRQISRQPLIEESPDRVPEDCEVIQNKICELKEEINKQQMIISQTSQALNLCNCTPEFSGSTEQVEFEKVLLVATHRRHAALHELQRLKVERTIRPQTEHAQNLPLEKGTLTISDIVLPMKQKYVTALAAAGGKGHHVVCLIKCGEQVVPTKLVSTVASNSKNPDVELFVPGTITLNNIYSDFTVTFEVYCLQAQEEFLPHEVKYHINNKKTSSKLTPKKSKQDSRLVMPLKESPAGPQAVRSPSFALMGYVVFSVQAVTKRVWSLNNTPAMSPLEGSVEMKISCELAVTVEHRGFLTMFEDVSGFGAWHRRWCLLKGHTLSYWKYPDDERKMAPIDTIDLKNCITKQVGPVSREICARLHTLLLERERIAYPQDKDTLVTVCKGDKTIIRHLLSADTKEERIEWCCKLNAALTALRMWGNP